MKTAGLKHNIELYLDKLCTQKTQKFFQQKGHWVRQGNPGKEKIAIDQIITNYEIP